MITEISIHEARAREQASSQKLVHAVRDAGGEDRDFADVQNSIYLAALGSTAKTLMLRQEQTCGDVYKRGPRRGQLKPSDVAKDHLTTEQLTTLEAAVTVVTAALRLRYPNGGATLADIKQLALAEITRHISAAA